MTLKKVYDMDPTTSTVDMEDKLFYLSESPTTDEKLTLKQHRDWPLYTSPSPRDATLPRMPSSA